MMDPADEVEPVRAGVAEECDLSTRQSRRMSGNSSPYPSRCPAPIPTPNPTQADLEDLGNPYSFELPGYSPQANTMTPSYHDSAIDIPASPPIVLPFSWEMLDVSLASPSPIESLRLPRDQAIIQSNQSPNNIYNPNDGILPVGTIFSGSGLDNTSWSEENSPRSWMCVFASLRISQRPGTTLDVLIAETRLALRHMAQVLDDADEQSLVCERAEICLMVLCLQFAAVSLTSARQRICSKQKRGSQCVRIGALELNAMDQRNIFGAIVQKEVESAMTLAHRVLKDMASVGDRKFMATGQAETCMIIEQLRGIKL